VSGNIIKNCLSGIKQTDHANISKNMTIAGNVIVNTDSVSGAYAIGSGIEIYNTENCLISNNTITNPFTKGIVFGTAGAACAAGDTVSGGIISGNIIKFDSSWHNILRRTPIGINLSGINDVTVSTNEIQSFCGISTYYYYGGVMVGSIKCRNIRVIDNRFIGLTTPIQMCAITASGASGWTIKGNKVWGYRFGVHTYSYAGSDVTITDNDISGCTDAYYLHANNKLGYIYTGDKFGFATETPDKTIGIGGGTDEYSISVASDKLTFWNDAATPVAKATLDSVGTFAAVAADFDSATVGAGGVWQRDWYYNAADSSIRIVFYNSILSRVDTVKCPQAK